MIKNDAELLRRYADARDEEAFSALVSRNIDFVWATAYRSCKDADLAKDISQDVFSDLARKARSLATNKNLVLAGWLYRATRHASAKAVRSQQRRIHREQEAFLMQKAFEFPEGTNEEARAILPEIDNAFDELKSSERDAVVLRYLKRKSLSEVGDELNISEEAARKRISRSLEKLRSHLERKGIKTASGSLAVMLTGISAQAAPVGIVTAITTSSIAAAETLGAASGILGTLTQLKTQAVLMKTQIAIGTLATAVVVTPLAIQQSRLYDLREENKNLRALVSQQSSNIQNTAIVPTENLASYTANAPVDVIETLKWQTVESDDYHKYIANLRSIGVPEETIRDIIVADVTKFYAKRMKEFRPEQKEFEFWNTEPDSRNSLTPPTKEQLENQLALVRERRALLKELLGEDYHDQPDMMQLGIDPSVSLLDFLPLDKRIALQELDRKYSLARPGDMSQTQEDLIESLNERQRLKELELSRILTPEEEFEYNLRMSSTAQTLRAQLDGFNPTKEEFLQMYLLKKAHDEQWEQPRGRMPGEEELQNMQAARENLQTEFKNLLGPERYSEYERAQDSVFQSMLAVTRTLELPEDTAARIYNVKQATQEYVNQLKSNPDLSEQEIENALQQIGSETQKEIIRIAGEDALQLLQNESGGRWLRITGPGQTVPTGVFSDPTVIGEGTVIRRAIQ